MLNKEKLLENFKDRWGKWTKVTDTEVICTSSFAKRRYSQNLEAEAKKLDPPLSVRYDIID